MRWPQAWTWRPSRWWRVASQRSWLGPYITYIQKRRSPPLRLRAKYPARSVTERFVAALTRAAKFDTSDPQAFIRLQNDIVDPRYAATGWRTLQSFIGETMSDFREHVHFVCPKPDDLTDLMNGWMRMMENLPHSKIDPGLCGGSSFVRVCVYTSIRRPQRANPPLSYTSRASKFWIHASSNAVFRFCSHDGRSKPLR